MSPHWKVWTLLKKGFDLQRWTTGDSLSRSDRGKFKFHNSKIQTNIALSLTSIQSLLRFPMLCRRPRTMARNKALIKPPHSRLPPLAGNSSVHHRIIIFVVLIYGRSLQRYIQSSMPISTYIRCKEWLYWCYRHYSLLRIVWTPKYVSHTSLIIYSSFLTTMGPPLGCNHPQENH